MRYPEAIEVQGVSIPINTDYRAGVEFELLIQDRQIEAKDKIIKTLELYFKALPEDIDLEQVIDGVLDFYALGRKPAQPKEDNEGGLKQAYDFNEDWGYIHAAFIQQYRIDLNTIEYLHWWQFRAMVEALDDSTQFKKIVGYRVMDIPKDMSKEQKRYYNKMKQVYKLPDKRTQEEIDEDFANSFF